MVVREGGGGGGGALARGAWQTRTVALQSSVGCSNVDAALGDAVAVDVPHRVLTPGCVSDVGDLMAVDRNHFHRVQGSASVYPEGARSQELPRSNELVLDPAKI